MYYENTTDYRNIRTYNIANDVAIRRVDGCQKTKGTDEIIR